jgi:hypothetical protein
MKHFMSANKSVSQQAELFQEARESFVRRNLNVGLTASVYSQVQLTLANINNISQGKAAEYVASNGGDVEALEAVFKILISPSELITFEM